MPSQQDELLELQRRVAELTNRVYRLEQFAAGRIAIQPEAPKPEVRVAPPAPTPPPPIEPSRPAEVQPGAPQVPSVTTPAFAGVGDDLESSTGLESRIGSQWLNRIGIVALLTGVAYFLKLAFDNNWIGPSGRISIGLLAGIVLVAWSGRFHSRGYKYFSYSLTAVGIGIMYLSLWAAFHLYHLIPGGAAFLAMVIVTASAATLALSQDAQVLAAVAIAGGFATPVLLSTGQNRPVELFSYIALLDVFSIALVLLRPWRRLLLGSFVGTVAYFIAWYSEFYTIQQRELAVGFATLFFLIFAVLPVIKHLHAFSFKDGAPGWAGSKTFIFVALVNPFVYFIELYAMYEWTHRTTLAWIAVALAAFYIVISKQLPSEQAASTGQGIGPLHKWLHLAIAITFLTIAIPLKLETHWITMGWFVEAAALLWVGGRAENSFLKNAAIAALALGVIRLLFVDMYYTQTLIFNSRFATYLVAIAVLTGIAVQVRKERGPSYTGLVLATICINILALLALNAEIYDFYARQFQQATSAQGYLVPGDKWHDLRIAQEFTYSALWMLYGTGLMIVGFWRKSSILRWQALVLMAATIAKVFLYDLSNLSGVFRVLSFIGLGALLMAISFIYQKDWLKLSSKESR